MKGKIPSKRSGHTLSILGLNAFLFGGVDNTSPPGPTNDIYQLKIGSGELEWSKPDVARAPLARWKHSAVM